MMESILGFKIVNKVKKYLDIYIDVPKCKISYKQGDYLENV